MKTRTLLMKKKNQLMKVRRAAEALAADSSSQVGKADKRRRNWPVAASFEIQKEYWGPPKPHRHALNQRLYTVKFDDGSIQPKSLLRTPLIVRLLLSTISLTIRQ